MYFDFRFPEKIGGNLPGVHYIRDVADADSLIESFVMQLFPFFCTSFTSTILLIILLQCLCLCYEIEICNSSVNGKLLSGIFRSCSVPILFI